MFELNCKPCCASVLICVVCVSLCPPRCYVLASSVMNVFVEMFVNVHKNAQI